jgi:cyclic lactone autoinducer peptide
MKNKFKPIVNIMGLCLIAVAGLISNSTCFAFWGEPTPPKRLLK